MTAQIPTDWNTVLVNTKAEPLSPAKTNRKRKRKNGKVCERETEHESAKKPKNTLESLTVESDNKQKIVDDYTDDIIDSRQKNVILSGIDSAIENIDQRAANIEKLDEVVSKNLLSVISKTNYKNILSGICTDKLIYTNNIQMVSKRYEETYLRQKISEEENQCIRKHDCECMFIDQSQSFIGVEYKFPWDTKAKTETNRGLCLVCLRATTQALFYDIMYSGVEVPGLIQSYYNEHSKEGEYKLSVMLFCPPNGPVQNLPMPIVRHQRNFYSVHKDRGIYYMKQLGMDFQ